LLLPGKASSKQSRCVNGGLSQPGPAEVSALGCELGRLHSRGLLQALMLSFRIADGLCQHLAKLRPWASQVPAGGCHWVIMNM
jgi:hypothetical protein